MVENRQVDISRKRKQNHLIVDTTTMPEKNIKGSIIISLQYFLYFGALGVYLPYFNLYLDEIGLSGFQIGAISSVRMAATAFFPLFWAYLADKFDIRKSIYISCGFSSAALFSLFLFIGSYYPLLILTFFYGLFYAPLISFLEAFSMDALGSSKQSYGKVRVWGSVSFIVFSFGVGYLINQYSVFIAIPVILVLSFLFVAASSVLSGIRVKKVRVKKKAAHFMKNSRLMAFLLAAFLMLLSHGAYYGFFSIHLKNIGYGSTFIGFLWALGTFSEISVMLFSKRIFEKYRIENVLIFSLFIACLRWLSLSYFTSPFPLVLSQLSHAVTYGAFHIGSILYIDHMFPEGDKTLGQATNNAVSYGMGMMAGFFLSGYLIETMGATMLFSLSGVAALAGAFILLIAEKPRNYKKYVP